MSNNLQKGIRALFDLEEKFLGNLQQAPSRVHNALRNVGKFPLIITTNMDELLERFLWKTGNGGEKLRLDQVGELGRLFNICKQGDTTEYKNTYYLRLLSYFKPCSMPSCRVDYSVLLGSIQF